MTRVASISTSVLGWVLSAIAATACVGNQPTDATAELALPLESSATLSDGEVACGSATSVSVALTAGDITNTTPVDLMLVIDDSDSISPDEFEQLRGALIALVDGLHVLFDNGGRVGIVMFEGQFSRWIGVNLYRGRSRTVLAPSPDAGAVIAALQAVTHQGKGTCISCGLDLATAELVQGGAPDHKRMAIVVTDGVSNAVARQPPIGTDAVLHLGTTLQGSIAAAHDAGIELFAVGVGTLVNPAELETIAEDPDSSHLFQASGFGELGVALDEAAAGAVVAPEATDAVLALEVNPAFAIEGAAADSGTVEVQDQRIVWSHPTLRDQTVTLSYQIAHRAETLGGDKPVHVGVTYSDAEGNTLDVASLSVVVSGCDRDDDGVPDETDNCRELGNADQADLDEDDVGDACDDDTDDGDDADAGAADPGQGNDDGADDDGANDDGANDDRDEDGDGVPDDDDHCSGTPEGQIIDAHGCAIEQLCPCEQGRWGYYHHSICVKRAVWGLVRARLVSAWEAPGVFWAATRHHCGTWR